MWEDGVFDSFFIYFVFRVFFYFGIFILNFMILGLEGFKVICLVFFRIVEIGLYF